MASFTISQIFGFNPDYLDYCPNGTYPNTTILCSDPIPPCRNQKRLEFASFWTITDNYFHACKEEPGYGAWLSPSTVSLATAALSVTAASVIVGHGNGLKKYTSFPKADFWNRLITWKFPLIQLIATFPRPTLGKLVEFVTILHLVADPIGSMEDLLWTLGRYNRRAGDWEELIREHDVSVNLQPDKEQKKQRKWWRKHMTMIVESYGELVPQAGKDPQKALEDPFQM